MREYEDTIVAAERLGVNRATIVRWCRTGMIACAAVQRTSGVTYVVEKGAQGPDLKSGPKAKLD